jgi:hypothetical protein
MVAAWRDPAAALVLACLTPSIQCTHSRRVQERLDGTGGMPMETRDDLRATTGRGLEDWVAIGKTDKEADG